MAGFETETGLELSLQSFVEYHQLELDDIYQRGTWSRLLVDARVRRDFDDPDEEKLARGLRRLAHVNGVSQLRSLLAMLPEDPKEPFVEPSDETMRRLLLMLHFVVWGRDWCPATITESIDRLRHNPTLYADLIDLVRLKLEWTEEATEPLALPFICPLELHADYTRDEALAALGVLSLKTQRDLSEGVLFVEELPADVFFITLDKTEGDYSPSTMYEDYAISENLFHWQSQSTTSAESRTGQRYINHRARGSHVLVLVRESKRTNGLACPYTFLGPASYVSSDGSRPMSIIWRLHNRLPARLLRRVRRLAV